MTYQPYSGGDDAPAPMTSDPGPVRTAVNLMFVRAALRKRKQSTILLWRVWLWRCLA